MLKIYTFYYYLIAHKTLDKLVPESEGTRLELILFPVHSLTHMLCTHTTKLRPCRQTEAKRRKRENQLTTTSSWGRTTKSRRPPQRPNLNELRTVCVTLYHINMIINRPTEEERKKKSVTFVGSRSNPSRWWQGNLLTPTPQLMAESSIQGLLKKRDGFYGNECIKTTRASTHKGTVTRRFISSQTSETKLFQIKEGWRLWTTVFQHKRMEICWMNYPIAYDSMDFTFSRYPLKFDFSWKTRAKFFQISTLKAAATRQHDFYALFLPLNRNDSSSDCVWDGFFKIIIRNGLFYKNFTASRHGFFIHIF